MNEIVWQNAKVWFFDLDDTLYKTESIYALGLERAFAVFYKTSGASITWDEFSSQYQVAREEVKVQLGQSPACRNRLLYFKRMLESFGICALAPLALAMDNAYTSAYHEIDFDPARMLLKKLRTRAKIALLTNQTCQAQLEKVSRLDPRGELIQWIITSEEAGSEKPAESFFKFALARTDCRAEEAVMVGDDWNNDIEGAIALGISAIFLNADQKSKRSSIPHFKSMEDLCSTLL